MNKLKKILLKILNKTMVFNIDVNVILRIKSF